MKKIKLIIHSVIFLFLVTNIFGQVNKKNVVWIHGFQGDSTSWRQYTQHFGSRMNVVNSDYNSANSLTASALEAKAELQNDLAAIGGINNEQNFVVAHSFGGLVSKKINADILNSQGSNPLFKGIITVGTPHRGTRLPISAASGEIDAFIDEGCIKLTTAANGIVSGSVTLIPVLPQLIAAVLGTNDFQELCPAMKQILLKDIKSQFQQNSSVDMAFNAPLQQTLINTHGQIPHKIGIYGSESSNLFARTLLTAAQKDNNRVQFWNFEEERDNGFNKDFNKIIDMLQVVKTICYGLVIANGIASFFNPVFLFSAIVLTVSAMEIEEGIDWLESTEAKWSYLIGASGKQTITTTEPDFICGDQMRAQMAIIRSNSDKDDKFRYLDALETVRNTLENNPNCWAQVTRPRVYYFSDPSDGIVPKFSAHFDGTPHQIKVVDANHWQLRNHPNMTNALKKIFNGDYVEFFRLNQ